ncbi:MAG TPA: SDR family NAD(P)-dependent oxidoreductase [Candidatus Limnocylindrales bacterium]|nr:SDR family NAD(P)-dependent oxidoreductase [Candidatus Limnocylindrales bacterium]
MPTGRGVAIVTGASRGVGRGIALGLGEAGWTVYLTGRTLIGGDGDLGGSLASSAAEVTRLGGTGIAARCDHADDADTAALFERVRAEQPALDLLVNVATKYATPYGPSSEGSFWEQPISHWDDMHRVGLRSAFVASSQVARVMVPQGHGLIVNVSSLGAIRYTGNVSYNVVKAGVDMLTHAMAQELRPHGVAVVSIWPRLTQTEGVLAHPELFPNAVQGWTPLFNGRVVARLAADPDVMGRTGQAFDIGTLANELEIDDVDGRRPAPRTLERELKFS